MNGGAGARRAYDVLITQGWGRIAYNVVRSLGRQRLQVIVGTDRFSGMAAWSRYASARFRHPVITRQTIAFVNSVEAALRRYSPAVYLPMNDDTFVAARFIERFQETGARVPIAPFEVLRTLHKKSGLMSLAASLEIPTPATLIPKNESDVRAFFGEYGPRIVLKRISSSGSRGVFYLNEDEFGSACQNDARFEALFAGDWIVQQYVTGIGYGVSMLFNRGALRAKFTHRRLREKGTTGGISTLRTGVVQPQLEACAQRLLESVRFHGVAMVEFKHDERTGNSWLIEVNPRFWGSVGLAIQSGVDFPYLLYRMALDGDVLPVVNYRSGLVVRWLLGDIGAAAARWRGRASWRSPLRAPLRADGTDDFFWDDPFPFVGGAALSVFKAYATRGWTIGDLDLDIDRLVMRRSDEAS
jgi:predicted ATP-grasp superfamily ATP-dependent carboligase